MPNASNRQETSAENRELGGSRTATNETKVSSAASPKKAQPMPKPDPNAPKPPKSPDDASQATGHDHPSQSEHARRLYEKLHGTSAQRAEHPDGSVPGKKKGGFNQGNFGKHGGPKSGPPRRTQAKGG